MSTPMKSTRAPGNDLVQTAVGSVAAARADLTRQAEELMQRNALLGRQRDSLAESTISFADYSKLLRQEIQALGEQYAHGLVGHESGSHPDMDMTWSDLQSGVIPEFTALLGAPLTMGRCVSCSPIWSTSASAKPWRSTPLPGRVTARSPMPNAPRSSPGWIASAKT